MAVLDLNDILVGITWIVFVLVVTATGVAYIMKPRKGRGSRKTQSFREQPSSETGASEEKEGESKSPRGSKIDAKISSGVSDAGTDESSLLGAETGLGPSLTEIDDNTSEVNVPDGTGRTLCETLKNVLAQGLSMTLYAEDGPKKVKIFLVGTELRWRQVRMITRKTFKCDLRTVQYVEWGKKTRAFRAPFAAAVEEDFCFSIVCSNTTVDLKAYNKVERDAVAQGFVMLLDDIRSLSEATAV
jgi:hypothetical protein